MLILVTKLKHKSQFSCHIEQETTKAKHVYKFICIIIFKLLCFFNFQSVQQLQFDHISAIYHLIVDKLQKNESKTPINSHKHGKSAFKSCI